MANEFLYKIGADNSEVDRALEQTRRLLAGFDQAIAQVSVGFSALAGAGQRFAQAQQQGQTAAQQFAAQLERQRSALQGQAAAYGKTEADLLRVKAAQLGVAQQSEAQIAAIEKLQRAQAQQVQRDQQAAASARALANIRAAAQQAEKRAYQDSINLRATYLRQLTEEGNRLGLTRRQIQEVQAALAASSREGLNLVRQLEAVNRTRAAGAANAGRSGLAEGAGVALRGAGALLGVGVGLGAVRQTTLALAEAQVTVDRLRTQFEQGFGVERAAQELDFVREAANRYGFELTAVASQYARFAASTRGTSIEGDVTRATFEAVAQAAAALSLNIEETEGVLRALTQIASKGRVQLEELSGQLGDRLPGVLARTARAFKITTAELIDLVQKGAVPANEFIKVFSKSLSDDFAAGAERAADRLGAANARLGNSFFNLKAQLAQGGFGDAYRAVVETLTSDIDQLASSLENARLRNSSFLTEFVRSEVIRLTATKLENANEKLKELRAQLAQPGADSPAIQRQIAQVEQLIVRLDQALAKQKQVVSPQAIGDSSIRSPGDIRRFEAGQTAAGNLQRVREAEETTAKRRAAIAEVTRELTGENEKYYKQLQVLQAGLLNGDFVGREQEYIELVNRATKAAFPDKKARAGQLDAGLKDQLDAQLAVIRRALQDQSDALDFGQQVLQGQYDDGLVAVADFYAQRAELTEKGVQAQLNALRAEEAALRGTIAGARDPNTRRDAERRLAEVVAERGRISVQASRSAALALAEELRAVEQLKSELQNITIDTLQLSGQDGEAERLRNAQAVAQAQRTATQLGQGQDVVADFSAALEQQRLFNEARRELADITERARLNEEDYLLDVERLGVAQFEAERKLVDIRSVSLRQLEALAARVQALAAQQPGNAELQKFAQGLALQVKQAQATIDPAIERLKAGADEAGQAIAGTFGQLVTGSLGGREAVAQLEQQLLSLLTRMILIEPLAKSIADALKGVGGGENIFAQILGSLGIGRGGSGSAGGAAAGAIQAAAGGGGIGAFLESLNLGGLFGVTFAKGGAFDRGRLTAFAQGGILDRPTLFGFGGGRVGLGGEAGSEGLLPLKRTARGDLGVQVAGGGGSRVEQNIHVTVEAAAGMSRETALQQGRRIGMGVQRALARNG